MLDAEDRQVMMEAVGVTAEVGAGHSMLVSPPEYWRPGVVYSDGLETDNLFCRAAVEDVDTLGIVAGDDGTVVTVSGHAYRVLSMERSVDGFVDIELGTV